MNAESRNRGGSSRVIVEILGAISSCSRNTAVNIPAWMGTYIVAITQIERDCYLRFEDFRVSLWDYIISIKDLMKKCESHRRTAI